MQTEPQVQEVVTEAAQNEPVQQQEQKIDAPVEAKADESTVENGESTPQQVEEDKAKSAKSSNIQKRIDELTFKAKQAEREAAHWRAQALANAAPIPPKESDFNSTEEYEQAMADHRIETRISNKLSERDLSVAKQHETAARQAVADAYAQRLAIAVTKIPDFVDVVGKSDIQISDSLIEALQESEFGPEITYNLAKNRDEALRLSQLNERQLNRELGRMEAMMSAQAPAARTTKAPAPASVSTNAKTPSIKLESASMDEFKAHMRANGSKWV